MMNDSDDDEEEDARKPAARPNTNVKSPSMESVASPPPDRWTSTTGSTTRSNDLLTLPHDENADNINVIQSIPGEIPFLITHWLTGYFQNRYNRSDINDCASTSGSSITTSLQSNEARNAAMNQIQKATNDLAVAFQTLGAFGTTRKVCKQKYVCIDK
jgi:hypothetical protein